MGDYSELSYVLVDDDADDRMLMRLALQQAKRTLPVLEFSDGQELIDYLAQDMSGREDQDMHWLVIMDINMPRLNGLDAVQALRENPVWAKLPVLMLSTADDPDVVKTSLIHGANGYLVKPASMQGYVQLFDQYFAPWLSIKSSQWPSFEMNAAHL